MSIETLRRFDTLKIVDYDGRAFQYHDGLYWIDSAGLHVRHVVQWNTADIERMEVDCGQDQQAAHDTTHRERDAAMDEVSRAGIPGPYDYVTGRSSIEPVDDSECSDGC
jgi:hypothetical protein